MRCGNSTLARFDSGAAPSSRFWLFAPIVANVSSRAGERDLPFKSAQDRWRAMKTIAPHQFTACLKRRWSLFHDKRVVADVEPDPTHAAALRSNLAGILAMPETTSLEELQTVAVSRFGLT